MWGATGARPVLTAVRSQGGGRGVWAPRPLEGMGRRVGWVLRPREAVARKGRAGGLVPTGLAWGSG